MSASETACSRRRHAFLNLVYFSITAIVFLVGHADAEELARIPSGSGPLSWLGNPPLSAPLTISIAADSSTLLITDSSGVVYPYVVRSPRERAFLATLKEIPASAVSLADTVDAAIHSVIGQARSEGANDSIVATRVVAMLSRFPQWVEYASNDDAYITYKVRGRSTPTVLVLSGRREAPVTSHSAALAGFIAPAVAALRRGDAVFLSYNGRIVVMKKERAHEAMRLRSVRTRAARGATREFDTELSELLMHPIDRATLLPR